MITIITTFPESFVPEQFSMRNNSVDFESIRMLAALARSMMTSSVTWLRLNITFQFTVQTDLY